MFSMFGADFGNQAMNAAYDMMVLDDIKKQREIEKEKAAEKDEYDKPDSSFLQYVYGRR